MKMQIFMIKKILKVDHHYTCLAVISSDSTLQKDGNYHLQVFFKRVQIN